MDQGAETTMDLLEDLLGQLGPIGVRQIATMLGTDVPTARSAVATSLGTLVGALARNAQDPHEAQSLRDALYQHADSDPFFNVLAGDVEGSRILDHILGRADAWRMAQNMSRFMCLSASALMKLMALLSPLIMALLAKRATAANLDAEGLAHNLDHHQRTLAATPVG